MVFIYDYKALSPRSNLMHDRNCTVSSQIVLVILSNVKHLINDVHIRQHIRLVVISVLVVADKKRIKNIMFYETITAE